MCFLVESIVGDQLQEYYYAYIILIEVCKSRANRAYNYRIVVKAK